MLTTQHFLQMKREKEKIAMITAYDYPSAKHAEDAEADMILVGDSLGMVVLGYESTVKVTVNDMIHHAKAARRGAKNTFIVVDMPFMSYHIALEDSIRNAVDIFQQAEAQAIKVEGASPEIFKLVKQLTDGGIPVMGHLGLTPQTVNVLGGYKVQGRDEASSEKLIQDAKQLVEHGAMAVVLECVPKNVGKKVTESIDVPVIGIGAGPDTDGQVLVYHDILQYGDGRLPKFVKTYADFYNLGKEAVQSYVNDVKQGEFPQEEHTY